MVKGFKVIFLWTLILTGAAFWIGSCGAGSLPEEGSPVVALYRTKCTVCHSWPHPGRHSAHEWDHYLDLMEGHMNKRGLLFEPEDKEIIRAYLHRNARKD